MAELSESPFLWQITPGLQVRPLPVGGRTVLALIWMPLSPPHSDDLSTRIMARLSGLQILHPKAPPLALLAKAISEIHPYAKATY